MVSLINISLNNFPLWLLTIMGFVLAFTATYYAIPSVVSIASSKSLFAMPNGRTSHRNATPNLGGVAIFGGFIISTIIIGGRFFPFELLYIILGLIILFIAGLKDDIIEIHPKSKLFVQIIAAALIAVLADIRIDNFNGLFNLTEVPYTISIVATIFVFIAIINGLNLIDGIDGLASGISIMISSVLGVWFWIYGSIGYTIMSFALVGSLLAFLRYNVFGNKNKIFMGDTGSLIIGLSIAILTIRFLQLNMVAEGGIFIKSAPAVSFGLLIIPLFDTLRVFIIRISQGKSPFTADRQHIHHRLLQLGLTHFQITLILISINLFYISMCYLLQGIGTIWLMIVILFTASLLFHFLVLYCSLRAKKVIDIQYLTIEKIKTAKRIKKLYGFQSKIPSLTMNGADRFVS
ncbi:MAG: undecaprenyl/decaprenyl-phosphate alpha-N-acetylglucosaminyl 1-phosphate transferase [Bacteroidales bacterium]|nr:undecaprenyl/decaprenyl-phosphate alpha-N-acetylglucosaminyl 1-phosphate transferase [Bacteroidales bacterium]